MNIYERIKAMCEKRGLSIADVEEKAEIGRKSMYNWTSSAPAADKLQRVAKVLGCSMEFLLGETDDDSTPISSEEVDELREMLHKNPETKALLSASANLTGDDINAVVEIIKRMNKEAGISDE